MFGGIQIEFLGLQVLFLICVFFFIIIIFLIFSFIDLFCFFPFICMAFQLKSQYGINVLMLFAYKKAYKWNIKKKLSKYILEHISERLRKPVDQLPYFFRFCRSICKAKYMQNKGGRLCCTSFVFILFYSFFNCWIVHRMLVKFHPCFLFNPN